MEFKKQLKIKDKYDFEPHIAPPNLQKRLEAFLKPKTQKKPSRFPVEILNKFAESLQPFLSMMKTSQFSSFQALKHHRNFSNSSLKKHDYLSEMSEIHRKIEFLTKKPCDFLQIFLRKKTEKTDKTLKLARIIVKSGISNDFYQEKTQVFFYRWRLISFESSLRKISAFHIEILQRQIIDQFSNLHMILAINPMKIAFQKIRIFGRFQRKPTVEKKAKYRKISFGICIFSEFFKEKVMNLVFFGLEKLKENLVEKKGEIYEENLRNANRNMRFMVFLRFFQYKKKLNISVFFEKIKGKNPFFKEETAGFSSLKTKEISLRKTLKNISQKAELHKKFCFSRLISNFISKNTDNFAKKLLFQRLIHEKRRKTLISYMKEWCFLAMKLKNPLIITKPEEIREKREESRENVQLNRFIMVNQALVNKELESQQKKKNMKLLILNQNLGLIELSVLFSRKQRLFMRTFINNFCVLGTFESKRYQEFEHYLKILQEEKVKIFNILV